jgi:hypothetical protein
MFGIVYNIRLSKNHRNEKISTQIKSPERNELTTNRYKHMLFVCIARKKKRSSSYNLLTMYLSSTKHGSMQMSNVSIYMYILMIEYKEK